MSASTLEVEPRYIADQEFLNELAPAAEVLVNRHLDTCKIWYPHEVIPYELGKQSVAGQLWTPDQLPLSDGERSALFVNTLTEDNLPYYFETIDRFTGSNRLEIWRFWPRRWTAEEMRHSHALRTYIEIAHPIDPKSLEDARMEQVTTGKVPDPETTADGFAYVPLQELATRISHLRTAQKLKSRAEKLPMVSADYEWLQQVYMAGYNLTKRVAVDENFHYILYRDLTIEGFRLNASKMMIATERQVRTFAMPGTGIIDFKHHAEQIAKEEIYNIPIHYEEILKTVVLDAWKIADLENLTPEAEKAREACIGYIARIGSIAARMKQRAADRAGKAELQQA